MQTTTYLLLDRVGQRQRQQQVSIKTEAGGGGKAICER